MTRKDTNYILKKIIKYTFVVLGTLCLLVGIAFFCLNRLFSGMCGNDVYSSYTSPDGKYDLIVFQRDCGATTGFSTQISLIKHGKKLPNKSGNVFIADGVPDSQFIDVTWQGNDEVIINNKVYKTYLQQTMVKGIRIIYKDE